MSTTGTDIHLEVERQLDDGTWDRIPHMPSRCTSCAEYDREKDQYGEPRGWFHPWVELTELTPEDNIVEDKDPGGDPTRRVRVDRKQECYSCRGTLYTHGQFFRTRNYDVFAILGNVRNGYGFAGARTSSGFVPISDGRGIPDDISQGLRDHLARIGEEVIAGQIENVRREEDDDEDLYEIMEMEPEGYWGLGDHSFSWVTLQEILDYDWTNGVIKEGWVSPWQFQVFRDKGRPDNWSGGVSGMHVEHISDTEMADRIDSGDIQFVEDGEVDFFDGRKYTTGLQRAMGDWDLPKGSTGAAIRDRNSIYCLIKWPHAASDSVGPDFWQQVEYLKELAPHGDYSRVRLVFGFDS